MKIFSASQIREWDAYTIANEPISSLNLMERASNIFTEWFVEQFPHVHQKIKIICGVGNNGGDGLAIARLLYRKFYNVEVFIYRFNKNGSTDFNANVKRLPKEINIHDIKLEQLPKFEKKDIIIDGIFGTGLSRSLDYNSIVLISYLNTLENVKISIDVPSGLFIDKRTEEECFQADYTFSFEIPKLAFLIPKNDKFVGKLIYRSINLSQEYQKKTPCSNHLLHDKFISDLIKKRNKFSHKGTYGHALLIAGSYGKMGAAILAAKATLRSGCGLLTTHVPKKGNDVMQTSVPEAMCNSDNNDKYFSGIPELKNFDIIGIGPGIGKNEETKKALFHLLEIYKDPMVIDADALNILSENKSYFGKIPPHSILTPHPKEFDRLFGNSNHDWDRFNTCQEKAQELNVIIILKGAHTCIALPNGECYFNSTGNPGMATAGSGDVLTGILTGLMAQKHSPSIASFIGVYVHGLAGDFAKEIQGEQSLIASDIIDNLKHAFQKISSE